MNVIMHKQAHVVRGTLSALGKWRKTSDAALHPDARIEFGSLIWLETFGIFMFTFLICF